MEETSQRFTEQTIRFHEFDSSMIEYASRPFS